MEINGRKDIKTRTRLDEIARNYDRFSTKVLAILLILTAAIFGLGSLSLWLSFENRDRQREINKLVTAIQNERQKNVLVNCASQNERHDNTIAVLNKIASQLIQKNPERAQAIRDSVANNVLFINALAPHQNCRQLLAQQVKTAHEPVSNPPKLGK